MASALTRAMGRMTLASSSRGTRMFSSINHSFPSYKTNLSFSSSIVSKPLQIFTPKEFAIASFATATRCSKSAEKRHRQSERRRVRHKERKTEIKIGMKKVFKALDAYRKSPPTEISQLDHVDPMIKSACIMIDKAVTKGTLHKNTAARRKSRLFRAKSRLLVKAELIPAPEKKPFSLVEEYEARKEARRAAVKALVAEQLKQEAA